MYFPAITLLSWHTRAVYEQMFDVNIKIAQTTQKRWKFKVGKLILLKKWQTSAIIWEISYSNLETGRYAPKSGVSQVIRESWQLCFCDSFLMEKEKARGSTGIILKPLKSPQTNFHTSQSYFLLSNWCFDSSIRPIVVAEHTVPRAHGWKASGFKTVSEQHESILNKDLPWFMQNLSWKVRQNWASRKVSSGRTRGS